MSFPGLWLPYYRPSDWPGSEHPMHTQVPFVAVHTGAGRHLSVNDSALRRLCADACISAMDLLRAGGCALDAAQAAVVALEDDPLTNAGYGSSLTREGMVECDAAIMDGRSGIYGCVGAVPSTAERQSAR